MVKRICIKCNKPRWARVSNYTSTDTCKPCRRKSKGIEFTKRSPKYKLVKHARVEVPVQTKKQGKNKRDGRKNKGE